MFATRGCRTGIWVFVLAMLSLSNIRPPSLVEKNVMSSCGGDDDGGAVDSTKQKLEMEEKTRGNGLSSLIMVNHQNEDSDNGVKANGENKKLFIFHVGPHKTATTTIQHETYHREKTTLREDNFNYLWRYSIKTSVLYSTLKDFKCRDRVVQALRSSGTVSMPECWDKLRSGFKQMSDKNLFISSEDLKSADAPREWWLALKEMVEEEFGYHMIIIVAYRRLFEWIPSAHSQQSKGPVNWGKWSYEAGAEVVTPIYPRLLQNRYINPNNSTKMWFHWTPSYLEAIPTDIIETRIFNIHGSPEHTTMTNFFCDVIPSMPATCQEHRNIEQNPSRQLKSTYNPSMPFWYDEIVIEAEKAGLIDTEVHARKDVWMAAWEYNREILERNDIDHFPWICPAHDELEMILDASLYWERVLIPNSGHLVDEHTTNFWKYASKKKYCSVDAAATIQQEEWKVFFQHYSSQNE